MADDTAGLRAACTDIVAGDIVSNFSQCEELAERLEADVFNYKGYYCQLQACTDLTDLKMTDSSGAYNIYRQKRFKVVYDTAFPPSQKKGRSKKN